MSGIAIDASVDRDASWIDRDWLAVVACMFGMLLSVAALTLYTFGVFVRPLHAEFGWNRTQLSVTISITQYAIGFSSPFWGVLADRFGPRKIILPTTVLLALLIGSLSLLTPHLWHLYLVFFLISTLGPSPVLHAAIVSRLFSRHLGLALGLALMGVGLAGAVMPSLAQSLVSSFGWRHAYLGLGALALVIGLPMALIATRHVHGSAPRRVGVPVASVLPSVGTRVFGLMCVVFVLLGIITIGTVAHLVPMMIDRKFSPAAAAGVAGLIGFAALVSRGFIGWVLDRLQAPRVLAVVALFAVGAFLLLALGSARISNYVAVIMLGGVVGAEVDFLAFMTRCYFPQELFGRLFGLLFLVFTLGGGTGPILMGLSFDHLGGYRPGLLLFAVVGTVAAAMALTLPKTRTGRLA